MMTLTLLLRLNFHSDGNHHHKKGMKAPSTLWKEARLTPEKLDRLIPNSYLIGIPPTFAPYVGIKRTKDVNTLQKSIVSYGWRRLFCMARHTTSRRAVETSYLGSRVLLWRLFKIVQEKSSLDSQILMDEGTSCTWVSRKTSDRRSHLSDAMRARLGPQAPSMEGQSCIPKTLRACLGPPATAPMSKQPSHLPRQ
ncbi:hypothetical protein AAG906_039809 [Vitis piasezkii]